MLLGIRTDTQDIEGKIIGRNEPYVGPSDIANVFDRFVGKIEQVPPRYSAIKFKGKSLYKWTRKGIDIEPPPRIVEIYNIVIDELKLPYISFSVSCSKGTYVRSLCSDIGDILGCGACLASLRRTRSGIFFEASAVSLEGIDDAKAESLTAHMIPLIDALPNLPVIYVDDVFAKKLRAGYQPIAESFNTYHIPSLAAGDVIKFIDNGNNLVSIAKLLYASDQINTLDGMRQVVKILRIFNSDKNT
jgi:tRNA pseudouridine55 synthase